VLLILLGEAVLDLLQLPLRGILLGLDDIDRLGKLLLALGRLFLRRNQLVDLRLKVPVLVLVSVFALVQGLQALLESLGFDLQLGPFRFDLLKLFFPLGEQGLQIADLGNQGRADLCSKLDVVDPARGLVADLAVRYAEFRRGGCSKRLELGGAYGTLNGASA
jgi:hypothetical protein